jgi:hypothetical protein
MVRKPHPRRIGWLSVALLASWLAAGQPAGAAGQVYVTWAPLEPDTCASIWLIKRHIDPAAIFRFDPPGTVSGEGIAFDTPQARFRRYHNSSTYQTLLRHHRLTGAALVYIGRLMHDIEVNVWERKALAETHERAAELQSLLTDADPATLVELCLEYFDRLSRSVPASGSPAADGRGLVHALGRDELGQAEE